MVRKTKCSAYFSLEATMVIPIALGVVFLVIYLMFFLYDRLATDVDHYVIAIQAGSIPNLSKGERASFARELLEEKKDFYIAWEMGAEQVRYEGNTLILDTERFMEFPFGYLLGWQEDSFGTYRRTYRIAHLDGAQILRNYYFINRVMKAKEGC